MKNISGIMCLVWICLSVPCWAQINKKDSCTYMFSGKVVDGETQEPLPGASISFRGVNKGANADGNGKFSISEICHGIYAIECSFFGYKPIVASVHIAANEFRNFVLHHDTCMMESIVITAPEEKEKSTLQVVQLKGKDLDRTRGLALGEALKVLPGVGALQTGPSIFKPVIQGMYGNRVLILNNDVRQEGQQWGSEHAPEIDPFVASKITIVKGAASVQYGADAIGGVIRIDPDDWRTEPGIGGEVNLVGFSNNWQGVISGRFDYSAKKIKGLNMRLQGTLKRAGNSKTPSYYMRNTGFKEYNFSWAAGYKRERWETELYYSQYNSILGIFSASHIGNLTDLKKAIESPVPLVTSDFSYRIDRPYQEISHELFKIKSQYHFYHLGKLQLTIARQYNYRSEYDSHRPYKNDLKEEPQVEFKITSHTAKVLLEHNSIGAVKGIAGIDFIRQGNTTAGTSRAFIPNFESYAGGIYVIERWKKNKLELEAGARYDYKWMKLYKYEKNILISPEYTFANVSGVAGAIYDIHQNWKMRLNIGTAFRPVAVNELFSDGLHHGASRLEYGNRDLVSEYAYNSSLTLHYQYKKIYGEVHAYNNYINNYIYLAPGQIYDSLTNMYTPEYALTIRGAYPVFRYKQIGAQFTGVDFTFNDSLSKNITISTKLSLLRAYNREAKEHIILTPPANFEYGIQYRFHFSKRFADPYIKLTHLLVARKSKIPNHQDVTNAPPGYMLFTLETGCRIYAGKQPLDFTFSVYNLLNSRYRDYMDRFRYYTDAVGRNFVIRMKVPLNFKNK